MTKSKNIETKIIFTFISILFLLFLVVPIVKLFAQSFLNNKIQLIIFDWAGTTVDYGSFAPVEAFLQAFDRFGINVTTEEIRKPMGMLKRDHIKAVLSMDRIKKQWQEKYGQDFTEADVDKVYLESEKLIMKILYNFTKPKPYVIETVEELRNLGLNIGSTTGYTNGMMQIVTEKAKEAGYEPDFFITPNDVNNLGRPYPYMIYENMRRFKVLSCKNVIKVGDTIADIKEGKNAGVITVGIIEGSSIMGYSKEEYDNLDESTKEKAISMVTDKYKEAGADYIVHDIREVLNIVKDINEKI